MTAEVYHIGQAPGAWKSVPIRAEVDGFPVALEIDSRCALDSEERYANCDIAKQTDFPKLVGYGAREIHEPCVLVGSGPSAIPLLGEIRERFHRGEEIIALKGAHDWLLENGVLPKAAIALDPKQSRAKCFKHPHPDVLYCCASQMHPDAWEHLKGHRVLIWHSRVGITQEQRPGWEDAFLIPACSTTGNSAIVLMYILGRRRFELYGFDSSLPPVISPAERADVELNGYLHKLDGDRITPDMETCRVTVGGSSYLTTAALAAQAMEIEPMLQRLPGVKVNAHGRGYYQAIINEGKALGWPI